MVVIVIVVVTFVLIGVFIALFQLTLAVQRVLQRHYHLLQKSFLAEEYRVVDLNNVSMNDMEAAGRPASQHMHRVRGAPAPQQHLEEDLDIDMRKDQIMHSASAPPMGVTPSAPPLPVTAGEVLVDLDNDLAELSLW